MRKTCDVSKEHPYTFSVIRDYLHIKLPQKHSLYVNSEVQLRFILFVLFYIFFTNTLRKIDEKVLSIRTLVIVS